MGLAVLVDLSGAHGGRHVARTSRIFFVEKRRVTRTTSRETRPDYYEYTLEVLYHYYNGAKTVMVVVMVTMQAARAAPAQHARWGGGSWVGAEEELNELGIILARVHVAGRVVGLAAGPRLHADRDGWRIGRRSSVLERAATTALHVV